MKSEFKLIFDTGKIFYIKAKNRGRAIESYCKEYGVSKAWVDAHCKVVNLGRVS